MFYQNRDDTILLSDALKKYLSILNGGPTATQVASEKSIYDADDQLRAKVRSRSWSTIRLRTLPKRWLGCTRQPSTRPVHAAVAAAWAELQRIYAAGVRGAVWYFARVGELVRVAAFFLDSRNLTKRAEKRSLDCTVLTKFLYLAL